MEELGPHLILFSSIILSLSSVIKTIFTPVIFKPAFHVNDGVLHEYIGLTP